MVQEKESPQISQVDEATSPIAAPSRSPRCPTIEASMKVIRIEESWARTGGRLRVKISLSCSLRESLSPFRILASKSVFIFSLSELRRESRVIEL